MGRKVNLVVIHCSASPNGVDVPAAELDRWHQRRGFERLEGWRKSLNYPLKALGYHYVVSVVGAVQSGRHHGEIGAHAQGHNQRSIGVCVVGLDKFTELQWLALRDLVQQLEAQYPGAKVCGHRDLSPDKDGDGVVEKGEWLKECPGFDVAAWLARGMKPDEAHVFTS